MTTDEDRVDRLRRLQERRSAPPPPRGGPNPHTGDRQQSPPANDTARRRLRAERSGSVPSGRHRAEASRVGAAGAGIVLTLSMMAGMARAERAPGHPAEPLAPPAVALPATIPPPPATTQAPVELAPATPPTTLATLSIEQRILVEPASETAAMPPARQTPQPPPQPETASHGSR